MESNLNKAVSNWRTTAIGTVLGLLIMWQGNGFKIPASPQEWTSFLGGIAIALLGVFAKDGATGSHP